MLSAYKRKQKKNPFHYTNLNIDIPIVYPHYEPASPQAEAFHKSEKHIKGLFGGDRSGKSSATSYQLISDMRSFPGCLFWSVALTEDKLSTVWEWHKIFLAPQEIKHISWRKSQRIPDYVELTNDSICEYKTWKSGAGSFSAARVKSIQLDEDGARTTTQAEQIFNDCLSRIIDNNGYIYLGATPVLGKNWMYWRLERGNQDHNESGKPDPRIETWHVSLLDNKFISDEAKQLQKAGMSKDEIDRRFYGLFTTLSGAVFKEFREDIHVLKEEPKIDASWRKIRAIDLGYENPFCCLWIAQDEDGCLWFYDEYYQARTLIKDHAANIERITTDHNEYFVNMGTHFRIIEATVCDHERQTREELHAAGVFTQAAQKDIDLGVQAVNRRLIIQPNGRARMYISPRCPNLIRQMGNCHYKLVKDGYENKEVIDKVDDHAVDPARYGVMYFETGARDYRVMQ
jgi:hypothetical protein